MESALGMVGSSWCLFHGSMSAGERIVFWLLWILFLVLVQGKPKVAQNRWTFPTHMLIEDVTPCLFKLFFYCLELMPPSSYVGRLLGGCTDEKIALLGAIQSLFEGSMYTFVFLWTPALSPNKQAIPHGFIFATFMLASMLGSSLASRLLARTDLKVESYMQIVFLVAAGSLCLPVLITVSSEFPTSLGVYVAQFLPFIFRPFCRYLNGWTSAFLLSSFWDTIIISICWFLWKQWPGIHESQRSPNGSISQRWMWE